MRHFIESHFGIVLILACFGGLVIPGLDRLPNVWVVIALSTMMFVSCYKLRDGGLDAIRWRDVLLFYVLRFVVLPVLLWWLAGIFAPSYATSVFLLSVLPAGVASPAFVNIYGGTVAISFAVVVLSQLLTPFLIPLQFSWMSGVAVTPSLTALFFTMVWGIFVPMAAYALLKKHRRMGDYFYRQNKFFSILLVAFIIALALAKQRDVIFTSGWELLITLAIAFLCFACYIVFGWLCVLHRPRIERITYSVCSGFNNAALGLSLALLHFTPDVILFMAISEVAWAMLPIMFRGWLRWIGTGELEN